MKLRHRALLRAGVAAAAVVAASTAFAAPAFAADSADLGIKLQGTTIAADAAGKFATLSVSNDGPGVAARIVLRFDLSDLEPDQVRIVNQWCSEEEGEIYCGLNPIEPGAEFDLDFWIGKTGDATGPIGTLKITVEHEGTDPNAANNTAAATVVLSEDSGADLRVWAPDVTGYDAELGEFTRGPVPAGDRTFLLAQVLNYGDRVAKGVSFSVSLPEHVTFVEPEPECDVSANKRVATCDYTDVDLEPRIGSGYELMNFRWAVKVDEDAPAPAVLRGGSVTAAAIAEAQAPPVALRAAPKAAELPEHFKDIDKTDNTDEFGVFVAEPEGTGGGLPVTGPAAGVIGGVGGAVVIAGVALFFLARRRRIVTVTPDA